MANIERVLVRAKGKIVNRERKEKREVWTVENINQPGLQRCLFTFFDGSLIQLELQYEYPDRNIEWYNQRIHDIRTYWDAKFGIPGKLITRSRDLDSDVIQTLLGYQWIVGQTTLELFYFSAEHDKQFFRTISYTYKAPFPGSR